MQYEYFFRMKKKIFTQPRSKDKLSGNEGPGGEGESEYWVW